MTRILKNNHGAALILTLSIVAVLLSVTLQFAFYVRNSVKTIKTENDYFKAEQIAISGIDIARLILIDDAEQSTIDSVQESWADPEFINDVLSAAGLNPNQLKLDITDELSKIQVNALLQSFPGNQFNERQINIWERLVQMDFFSDSLGEIEDASQIINPLKDWLDSGDDDLITGLSGAEAGYYENLDSPYQCSNGSILNLDELSLVKGFESFQENRSPMNQHFTVWGMKNDAYVFPGKININTADILVLKAVLPEGYQTYAEDLADYRLKKIMDDESFKYSLEKDWYQNILSLPGPEKQSLDRLIQYSSNYFRVHCIVQLGGVNFEWSAVLIRTKQSDGWTCDLLQIKRD